jgi:hypothetical protein
MIKQFANFNLRVASEADIPAALRLAESLTGQSMASAEAIAAVHALTGITVFVDGIEELDGVMMLCPLSTAGEAALRDGSFDLSTLPRSFIAAKGEPCSALYCGVYAGRTRDARRNVMQCAAIARVEIFASVPVFARAATADGARSMTSLGYGPLQGGIPDLWVQEAILQQKGDAA